MTNTKPTTAIRNAINVIAAKGIFVALPIVFLWFGGMKFTAYEAGAIEGLIANSPFVSFILQLFGTQGTSNLIGTIELIIAGLLALRFVAPKFAAIGAAGATLTFLLTSASSFQRPASSLKM